MRVGTQGFFHLCLKTFVAPFLPARLTAPGSPRMEEGTWSGKENGSLLECRGDIRYAHEGYWPYRGVGSVCFSAEIGIVDIHSSEYVWIAFIQTLLYFSFRCFGKHRRARERKMKKTSIFFFAHPYPFALGVNIFYHARSTDFEEKIEGLWTGSRLNSPSLGAAD